MRYNQGVWFSYWMRLWNDYLFTDKSYLHRLSVGLFRCELLNISKEGYYCAKENPSLWCIASYYDANTVLCDTQFWMRWSFNKAVNIVHSNPPVYKVRTGYTQTHGLLVLISILYNFVNQIELIFTSDLVVAMFSNF